MRTDNGKRRCDRVPDAAGIEIINPLATAPSIARRAVPILANCR